MWRVVGSAEWWMRCGVMCRSVTVECGTTTSRPQITQKWTLTLCWALRTFVPATCGRVRAVTPSIGAATHACMHSCTCHPPVTRLMTLVVCCGLLLPAPGTLGEQWAYSPTAVYKDAPTVIRSLIGVISKVPRRKAASAVCAKWRRLVWYGKAQFPCCVSPGWQLPVEHRAGLHWAVGASSHQHPHQHVRVVLLQQGGGPQHVGCISIQVPRVCTLPSVLYSVPPPELHLCVPGG